MKRIFSLFSLFLLSAVSHAATGNVSGRVVNKTTGKGAAGVVVKLVKPGESGSDKQIGTTKSGPDGQFSFGPFTVGSEDIFMAQTEWQNFRYETVAYDGTGHLKEMGIVVNPASVELPIFDVTRTAPELVFQVHHLAVQAEEKAMKVTERIVVQNTSKETFIGDEKGATIRLDIPPTAKDVTLDERSGAKLVKNESGYAVAKPITPAEYQRRNAIIVNYTLDWPQSAPWDRKLDLSKKVFYPTKFFFVARNPDDKGITLSAPQLGKEERQEIPGQDGQPVVKLVNAIGGMPMMNKSGMDKPVLQPGETVSVVLQRPVNPLVWAFVMFIVALIAIVPLALRSGKNKGVTDAENPVKITEPTGTGLVLGETFRPTPSDVAGSSKDGNGFAVSGEAQELIFAIARLDEEFAQGAVDKETYQKQRATWKKQLTDLLS